MTAGKRMCPSCADLDVVTRDIHAGEGPPPAGVRVTWIPTDREGSSMGRWDPATIAARVHAQMAELAQGAS